jgi:hypothetical protein
VVPHELKDFPRGIDASVKVSGSGLKFEEEITFQRPQSELVPPLRVAKQRGEQFVAETIVASVETLFVLLEGELRLGLLDCLKKP